jgi:hypothetical protein
MPNGSLIDAEVQIAGRVRVRIQDREQEEEYDYSNRDSIDHLTDLLCRENMRPVECYGL